MVRIKGIRGNRMISSWTKPKFSEALRKWVSVNFGNRRSTQHQVTRADFIEWFVGLTDGEGYFGIISNGSAAFKFIFRIELHVDEEPMLNFIKSTLGFGKVYSIKDSSMWVVANQSDIVKLIDIFTNRPLNTTKLLNFLAFKSAFETYTSATSKKEVLKEITSLKTSMNTLRTDYTFPSWYQAHITPNWLLGFVEGEGSFSVHKKYYRSVFSLDQSLLDLALMQSIANFLYSLVPGQKDWISIILTKKKEMTKGMVKLIITQEAKLTEVIIPFFDKLNWHSKKAKDYLDWKVVLKMKGLGLQYQPKGVEVLDIILSQMNKNRLSTAGNPLVDRSKLDTEINNLLTGPSNYEMREGEKFIKSLNRNKTDNKKRAVELRDAAEGGCVIKTFDSILACAEFLGIPVSTLKYKIKQNRPVLLENKNVWGKKL